MNVNEKVFQNFEEKRHEILVFQFDTEEQMNEFLDCISLKKISKMDQKQRDELSERIQDMTINELTKILIFLNYDSKIRILERLAGFMDRTLDKLEFQIYVRVTNMKSLLEFIKIS